MHYRHLLVVFGGLKGLEYSLECDESLRVGDVSLLFHHYLNTCPGQGSRTIRTEVSPCLAHLQITILFIKAIAGDETGGGGLH